MNPRVNGHNGHANQQAEQATENAHDSQMQEARTFTRFKVQHTKMQRARMLRNKMAAAFWKGKSFAGTNKLPSPSAQKLARFGQRPRPESYGKGRAKNLAAHERPEDGPHALDLKNEHEHKHNDEQQKQGQQHKREREREREHEHEHEQQKQHQEHGRERGDDQQQGQQQNQGQNGGQSPQQEARDGQQRREDREQREKPRRSYAVKPGKIKAVRTQALANPMQLLAREKLGSPDLPATLAVAGTKAALELLSRIPHDGPLLLVPYLLNMTSPLRMVHSRKPARLHSHHNAALAYGPALSGKNAVTAKLHVLSFDNTLARQGADIDYNDADQSIAMIKQRILDTLGGIPAANAPVASDTTREVRMPPAVPGTKT